MGVEIIKMATALIGSGGIVAMLVKHIIQSNSKKRKQRIRNIWASFASVANILRIGVSKCGASRVLVIKSTNGGGIPGPTRPAEVTVLYNECDAETRSIVGKWSHVRPDHQYSELLRDLSIADDGVHIITDSMENGDLRTLYERDGTKQSFVYRLAANEFSMIFLSFNFRDGEELNAYQKDSIREVRQALKDLVIGIDPDFEDSI